MLKRSYRVWQLLVTYAKKLQRVNLKQRCSTASIHIKGIVLLHANAGVHESLTSNCGVRKEYCNSADTLFEMSYWPC